MAHKHPVVDSDARFVIDPYSRKMKDSTPSDKTIIRGDHNSEIYTFAIPRFIEGHDMTLCNKIEVRFENGKESGFLPIVDFRVSPDDTSLCIFSWKVTKLSTQNVAPLSFSFYFACVDENGEETYTWQTDPFRRITVNDNLGNYEVIDRLQEQIDEYIELHGYIIPTNTLILVDENGNELAATYANEQVTLTATADDIRLGSIAVTADGVTEGTKEIPSYHTTEGTKYIRAGDNVEITMNSTLYEFTKLIAVICEYNTSLSDSFAAQMIAINDNVYAVGSSDVLATITVDADNQTIDLGFTNTSDKAYVIRFMTYKEEA